jgi:integrase
VGTNLKELWLASTFKNPGDYVFAASPDRPRSQEWARKVWVRIRGRAMVSERVRMHDLRHTFASILIGRGASPVELAEQLGDSVQVARRRTQACSIAPPRNRRSIPSLKRLIHRL